MVQDRHIVSIKVK